MRVNANKAVETNSFRRFFRLATDENTPGNVQRVEELFKMIRGSQELRVLLTAKEYQAILTGLVHPVDWRSAAHIIADTENGAAMANLMLLPSVLRAEDRYGKTVLKVHEAFVRSEWSGRDGIASVPSPDS